MQTFISDLSQLEFPIQQKTQAKLIQSSILQLIQKDCPTFNKDSCLAASELNMYKSKYIANYLMKEIGELSNLENIVLDSFEKKSTLSDKVEEETITEITFGQKLADKVATFGGSWTFITTFMSFLIVWILINIFWFNNKGYDPYPFILLNLILSCIAALQAPVIMMSQNRQEEKDRERAKKDYMINLKSELEIRILHEKIDHLIINQQQELIEIQKNQMQMMKNIFEEIAQIPKK